MRYRITLPRTRIHTLSRFIEEGGDWDRRNRLKVYRGLHMISIRQFKTGGELLLDALSTFTATELTTYNDFVALTIIINALTLKRVDLKKRVRCIPYRVFPMPSLTIFHVYCSSSPPLKSSPFYLNYPSSENS